MIKVKTKDSSTTYYSEKYSEHYHSISGAREEAVEKHVKPAIRFLLENNIIKNSTIEIKKLTVLDFCFGLGYNSFCFIKEMRKINKDISIEIIGVENDFEILKKGFKLFRNELIEEPDLHIIIGNGEQIVKKIKQRFDVCFFDPFSPKKCPELWSGEVFKDIYKHMKKRSILTTYSCAKRIRENMRNAGFIVKDGPIVGRKAPATIAIKE